MKCKARNDNLPERYDQSASGFRASLPRQSDGQNLPKSSVQDIMKVDAASSTRKARQASLAWAELTRQRFIGVLDAGMPASHIPRGFIDRNLRAKTDDLDRRCNKT
jgi:hypothetical protein